MSAKSNAAIGAIAFALFAATGANAAVHRHHHHMMIEMMGHTTATMKDGTKLDVDIIQIGGHKMIAIPAEELPDYLHQQIFRPGQ